jgi:hypothetical protein
MPGRIMDKDWAPESNPRLQPNSLGQKGRKNVKAIIPSIKATLKKNITAKPTTTSAGGVKATWYHRVEFTLPET